MSVDVLLPGHPHTAQTHCNPLLPYFMDLLLVLLHVCLLELRDC